MTDTPAEKTPEKSEASPIKDSNAPKRDELGRLLPGETANPEGNNGHLEGWQRYGTRLQRYGKMPLDELEAIIASAEFKKFSAFDRAAVFQAKRIANETDPDHIPERERGNDRIEGKSSQPVKHGGDPDNPTPISMDGVFTLTFGTDENDGSQSSKS